jgi:hypothetical protein
LFACDIANKRQYAFTAARQFFHCWIDVFPDDVSAARCEKQGGSTPDSARGTRHDCDLTFQVALRILSTS